MLPLRLRQSSVEFVNSKSFRIYACTGAITAHGPPFSCTRAAGSLLLNINPFKNKVFVLFLGKSLVHFPYPVTIFQKHLLLDYFPI
jgi:hypothetical protein